MQKDRLGSTTQILDETGVVLHTKSYDAFGKPRNGDWTDMSGGLFQAKLDFNDPDGTIDITKRGFTDHEHLDEMQLIHMNGRMYDYNNGRFLSVDPFIVDPSSTQALNPYTYIFNNPLSGVDPSGYNPIIYGIIRFALKGKSLKSRAKKAVVNARERVAEQVLNPTPTPLRPIPPINTPQPSNPTGPTTTTSPEVENFGSSTTSPVADQTTPNNTANDNGNQNSNQGTMMNENKGDTSETEGKTPSERLDNLIGRSKNSKRTPGNTSISEFPDGDSETLFNEFDNIGGNVTTDTPGLKVSNLDDGRTVIARNKSRDGRPTLEVQKIRPNGNKRSSEKIRFGSKNTTTTGSHIPDKYKKGN